MAEVGASLDDLLQDLSEEVGRRLVLLDDDLCVVGYSIHESDEDRERLGQVLAHSDSWARPSVAAGGWRVRNIPQLGRVLFAPVDDQQRRVGHLITVLRPAESPEGADLAPLLVGAARLGPPLGLRALRGDERRGAAARLLDELFAADEGRRSGAAAALIDQGLLGGSGHYCAVALGAPPGGEGTGTRTALAVRLTVDFVARTSTASVAGGVLGDGVGVLVFPRPVVAERLGRILGRPELAGVRAGIGPVVGTLGEVPRSFARARAAWRAAYLAADRHPVVLNWVDAGLDGVLAMLPLEDIGADDLGPPIRRLLAEPRSAAMIETLEAYLAAGGDARATARVLCIHRSTLYYRLGRIRTVAGVELSDGGVRGELQAGLRLARLAGLIGGAR
ncbi:PucR family transcriptional regulator [Naumannella huperziae]